MTTSACTREFSGRARHYEQCPFCTSTWLKWETVRRDGETIYMNLYCGDCHAGIRRENSHAYQAELDAIASEEAERERRSSEEYSRMLAERDAEIRRRGL